MTSRRQFLNQGSLGFLSTLIFPLSVYAKDISDFNGLVVSEDEGEVL